MKQRFEDLSPLFSLLLLLGAFEPEPLFYKLLKFTAWGTKFHHTASLWLLSCQQLQRIATLYTFLFYQKQTYGYQRGNVGGSDQLGDWDWHIHTTIYKIDK